MNNEKIQGTFYEQKLQKSDQDSGVKNGKKEIFVKWEGYDKSFNSWIPFDNQV